MMKNLPFVQLFDGQSSQGYSFRSIWRRTNLLSINLMFLLLVISSNYAVAQHCGGAAATLAKWDFNSENIECNGAINMGPTPITNPSITPGAQYCPNQNNGCGITTLGSVGHQNTPQYQNAICLANFYAVEQILASGQGAPYDPDAITWDPEGKANLSVWYELPENTEGCLTSFLVTVLQKQFDGSTLNFETQGIAVKRNGVLVYSDAVAITPANVNGTPFNFTFTGDEFCSDGSELVQFEVIFGLVHRLTGPALPGQPGQTGYDDVCLNGFCKTQAFGGIIPAVCGASGIETDAQVLIQNFEPGNTYDFNEGDSYTGMATFASGSLPIPVGGLIPNFVSPVSPTNYTFRVFQEENCFSDFTVTLDPQFCCVVPSGSLVVTPASCSGDMANDDAQITVTGVMGGGTRVGISTGTTYSGPAFNAAEDLVGGEFTFTNLPNPLVSQAYTVRLFIDADCFIDYPASVFSENCTVPCIPPNGVVLTPTPATCNMGMGTRNPDASIAVTGVNGGDRVGYSPSIAYSGPDYDNAFDLVNGAFTFNNIATPNGDQIYTVRVYNTSDGCYIDQTVVIEDPQCGDQVNIGAFVTTTGPNTLEEDGTNNQDAFESTDDGGFIDLALTKTVSPENGNTCIANETPFVWTLSIINEGDMTATDVNVVDLIPEGLVVTATNPSKGVFFGGSGWDIGDLAANETATLTITTRALSAGTYENCAYVNSAEPDNDVDSSPDNTEIANEDDDDCATITVVGDNTPTIDKSFSPMLTQTNEPTRLTIKITNNHTSDITLTSDLVDVFPTMPGQMAIAATPNLYVSSGITPGGSGVVAMANGTSVTIPSGTVLRPGLNQISLDIVVPTIGDYCNDIAAGALMTDIGDNCEGAEGCLEANPDFNMPPIVTTRMIPEEVNPGETSELVITIDNRNNTPMTTNQDFVNEIPPGLVVDGPVTSTGDVATLENGDTEVLLPTGTVIPPTSIQEITIPLRSDVEGTFQNTIIMNEIITTVDADNNLGNEEVSEAVLQVQNMSGFDLALRKTLGVGQSSTVMQGDDVTFSIFVENQGTVDATNINVTEYLPSDMTFDSYGTLPTTTTDGQAVSITTTGGGSFTIDALNAGDDVTIDIVLTVGLSATGTLTNNAEIVAADGGVDEDGVLADDGDRSDSTTELATNDDIDDDGMGTEGTIDNTADEDDWDLEQVTVVVCEITPMASSICVDGNSPSDPGDDTHTVTVSASVMNGGMSNQYQVLVGMDVFGPFTYGSSNTFSLDADGSSPTLTFQDIDDNSCTATVDIGPLTSCSDLCVISPLASSVCADGGTLSDPGDDTHTVTVSATAMNGGASNQYEVLVGMDVFGPFNYGGNNTFSLDADTSSPTLTFRDVDDNMCTATVDIGPLDSCSDECGVTITSVDASCEPGETGKYDLTIELSFANSPGGIIEASLGTGETALSTPTVAGDFGTRTITFTGLSNTGAMGITIDVAFDEDLTCNDQTTYDSPMDCCPNPQSICELTGESYTLTAEAGLTNYQWSLDGLVIPGANQQIYIATEAGVYTWEAIDGSNCPIVSCCDVELVENCDALFDLALIKRLDSTVNTGPFSPGDDVVFEIEVYNQGDFNATDVEVKDYIPEGLTLAAASSSEWTLSGGLDTATLIMPIPTIAVGDSATVSIAFTIDTDFMGESIINLAEISSFDDDGDPMTPPPTDEDSTPNDNGDDDPETDTDDDVDDNGTGTPGVEDNPMDEDDFDPAEVQIVQSFDLALIKQLDTMTTPGPFSLGGPVSFIIEVRNQGSVDATDVIVTDYIPDGLSLVASANWNLSMGNAVLATPFDLAAGDTTVLSISFTIDSDFTGTEIFNTAEVTQSMNELDLPDEDSTPGDNENDDPEVDSDDEDDDDGANGNGNADDPMDEDDFDFARINLELLSLGSTVFVDNNNDGFQNGADVGIPDVEVQLWDGTTKTQSMTGPDGLLGTADDADPTPATTN
ncbi:MAG: DUF11 domain-containing protein, partial [Bacteroidota bacterium]